MAQLYGKMETEYRDIILSFDDGPNSKTTGLLLDILDECDVRAMFFVVGNRLQSCIGRSIVERAHESGHVIGNHTYNHPNLSKLSIVCGGWRQGFGQGDPPYLRGPITVRRGRPNDYAVAPTRSISNRIGHSPESINSRTAITHCLR